MEARWHGGSLDRFEIGEFLGGCNPSLKIPSKNISEPSILNNSSCFAPQASPNSQLQLNEDWSNATECTAGEEATERTADERPYRFRDSLGHFKPINFQFHVVVRFLLFVVKCGG